MRFKFDSDLHIHSKLSLCSLDEEQNNERILKYAKDFNLNTICLTDHFWDENIKGVISGFYTAQNYEHVSAAKPLPQSDDIRFLFGCETEMDMNMNVGISKSVCDKFDFIIVPTTHMHMIGYNISPDVVMPQQKADLWLEKFNVLLSKDLPFHKMGIAHLACPLIDRDREKYLETLNSLKTEELKNVFSKAEKVDIGIELNSSDMKFSDGEADTVLRIFKIAKDVGCKFYMGSDAHHPAELDNAKEIFERAIDLLELCEEDKFLI